MIDPWAHRASSMRCKTCMWFVIKEIPHPKILVGGPKDEIHQLPGPGGTLGRCRRHSPTLSGYPVVFDNDWCGDHKLDEYKL